MYILGVISQTLLPNEPEWIQQSTASHVMEAGTTVTRCVGTYIYMFKKFTLFVIL